MARTRLLSPGFFTHEGLLAVPPLARILFAGLWCHADRRGLLEDRPIRLKLGILPADSCDVDELLGLLAGAPPDDEGVPLVYRFQVNGRRLLWLPRFYRQQHVHHREALSVLPLPEESMAPWIGSVFKGMTALAEDEETPTTTQTKSKPKPKSQTADQRRISRDTKTAPGSRANHRDKAPGNEAKDAHSLTENPSDSDSDSDSVSDSEQDLEPNRSPCEDLVPVRESSPALVAAASQPSPSPLPSATASASASPPKAPEPGKTRPHPDPDDPTYRAEPYRTPSPEEMERLRAAKPPYVKAFAEKLKAELAAEKLKAGRW